MPAGERPAVYLTFDDGPHPEATAFALDQLKAFQATATFFCIGKNVAFNPELYQRILDEGHTTGNHTEDHLNGWKHNNRSYLSNIFTAGRHVQSKNFRPPYGRIKMSQARQLSRAKHPWRIFMWDVLSGDFDPALTPEQCLQNVVQYIEPGSIVVFHDSAKAFPRMSYALPEVLKFCQAKNWAVKALPKYQ